jgi:hypothetical protein
MPSDQAQKLFRKRLSRNVLIRLTQAGPEPEVEGVDLWDG